MTPVQRSNNNLKIMQDNLQSILILGSISKSTLDYLTDKSNFLKWLVDNYDPRDNATVLKTLVLNYKASHKILCDIDEKIHRGELVEYDYPI